MTVAPIILHYILCLLQKRLDNSLENNNLLSPNQTGFRKGFRTTDNIFILKTVINNILKSW